MRLSIGKSLIIIICVILLGGLVYVDSLSEIETNKIELSFVLEDEIINAWKGEETYYLFLPSYASLENVKLLSYATEFEILEPEAIVMRGGTLAGLSFDEVFSCKTAATKEGFQFCLMKCLGEGDAT